MQTCDRGAVGGLAVHLPRPASSDPSLPRGQLQGQRGPAHQRVHLHLLVDPLTKRLPHHLLVRLGSHRPARHCRGGGCGAAVRRPRGPRRPRDPAHIRVNDRKEHADGGSGASGSRSAPPHGYRRSPRRATARARARTAPFAMDDNYSARPRGGCSAPEEPASHANKPDLRAMGPSCELRGPH